MNRIYLVKLGKSFTQPWRMRTVGAFDTTEEAEQWIHEHIRKGQHMYIEPVEKIGKTEINDIMNSYNVISMKGE